MSDILILGNKYSRKDLGELFNQKGISTSQEGIYSSPNFEYFIFFVDLVKEGKDERFHFNDYFEEDIFHWDSQPSQHLNVPRIRKIINKEVKILLFTRILQKIKSKTQPFVYCGELEYLDHDENTSNPIHLMFQSIDYDENTQIKNLIDIYNWKPEKIGKTSSN